MTAPTSCGRRHKKTRFEEKRPDGECGGAMDEVRSDDGRQLYGYVCRTCGAGKTICEGCGDLFVDLKRHLFASDGKPRECYALSPIYRRAEAAADFGKGAP